jgi:uncharacterized protein (DUF2267 family)
MQATHVDSLERTVQKTNEWLEAIQTRATLHALRDRLAPDEALHLGAQLPTLVRGVYYEGWRLADKPLRIRDRDEFLGVVMAESGDPTLDAESAVRAVFRTIADKVTPGEVADVKNGLPAALRELWP